MNDVKMNKPKYKFTSNEHFTVKGRGIVYSINEYLPNELYDPRQLNDEIVQINDIVGRVTGVESFAIGRSQGNPYKLKFGIMINERI